MAVTVRELAVLLGGELVGDGDTIIAEARSLDRAGPGHVTFVENDKHAHCLAGCAASAVVVPRSLDCAGRTAVRVGEPLAAFLRVVEHLRGVSPAPPGIDPRAAVHPTAAFGPDCSVQPFACVGEGSTFGARCRVYAGVVVGRNCRVGDDVILYPNAVLYEGTVLGDRVIVHANAVLGADGFGYRFQDGRHVKVPQLGHVEVGDDVEVGAGTTIDRGTFDATRVDAGTKIDNQVQVGHNCHVGPHNMIVSQVGIGGSSTTGAYVVLAGQAGVADHVHIGDGAVFGVRCAIHTDLPGGMRYLGQPAMPEREAKRILATLTKLPELRQDVQRLKRLLYPDEPAAA